MLVSFLARFCLLNFVDVKIYVLYIYIYESPPNLCTNSAHISKDSGNPNGERNEPLFCKQDKEILSIWEELEEVQSTSITDSDQTSGYFCSDTAFNLSKKSLVRYGNCRKKVRRHHHSELN